MTSSMEIEITTTSDRATKALGQRIGTFLFSRISMGVSGDIGAGKTTFIQGLAKGIEVPDHYYITSPTYNIINEYPGRIRLIHMDLYRLSDSEELEYLGFDDILASCAVTAVEWPEIIDKTIFVPDLDISIVTDSDFNRKIRIIGTGLKGKNLLNKIFVQK